MFAVKTVVAEATVIAKFAVPAAMTIDGICGAKHHVAIQTGFTVDSRATQVAVFVVRTVNSVVAVLAQSIVDCYTGNVSSHSGKLLEEVLVRRVGHAIT
jgi:hypothetical protein